jgi:hypothetical protein
MPRCSGYTKDRHQCIRNAAHGLYCKSHIPKLVVPNVTESCNESIKEPVPIQSNLELPTLYDYVCNYIQTGTFHNCMNVHKSLFAYDSFDSSKSLLHNVGLAVKLYKNSVYVYRPAFVSASAKRKHRIRHARRHLTLQEDKVDSTILHEVFINGLKLGVYAITVLFSGGVLYRYILQA